MNFYLEKIKFLCHRRQYDLMKVKKYFEQNGAKEVNSVALADIVIYFSCGFINVRQQKSISDIKRILSKKDSKKMIISGCLPAIAPELLEKCFQGRILLPKNMEKIDSYFPQFRKKFITIPELHIPPWQLTKNKLKFSVIKISSGCSSHCTYCGIRKAIGSIKSRTPKAIISDARKILKEGNDTIHLVADNIAQYGIDINTDFPNLLKKISLLSEKIKLVINDYSAPWIIDHQSVLKKLTKQNKISFLKIIAISGSERLLKKHNKYYKVTDFKKIVTYLALNDPDMYLQIFLIIGLPGETEKDLHDTLKMIESLKIKNIQAVIFSDIKSAETYKMKDKISQKIKLARIKKLNDFLLKKGYKIIINKDSYTYNYYLNSK